MNKRLVKGIAVVVTAIGAVGVCYGGYKVSGQRQYEQRVEYANKAIDKSKSELAAIAGTIDQFYEDDGKVFLRGDLLDSDIAATRTKLDSVKANAEEYGIQSDDLKDGATAIIEKKKQLTEELNKAQDKQLIQTQTNNLFENLVSSWKQAVNDVVIKEDTRDDTLGQVRESLKLSKIEDGWSAVVLEYLDFANAQVARVNEIEASVQSMLQEGQVTEAATYEGYLNLANSISQVRNQALKDKFTTDLTTIGNQLNSTSSSTSNSTDWSSSYDDGASATDDESNTATDSDSGYQEDEESYY